MRFEPKGITLICEGLWGCIFEVTPGGEIVWEYVDPFTEEWNGGPLPGPVGALFRAYRYAADSPEIGGRRYTWMAGLRRPKVGFGRLKAGSGPGSVNSSELTLHDAIILWLTPKSPAPGLELPPNWRFSRDGPGRGPLWTKRPEETVCLIR